MNLNFLDLLSALKILKVPQTDGSGNIVANVIPRTGTLASLLALAGGNGEISSATDSAAIVKHNGQAGQAVAFYSGGGVNGIIAASAGNTTLTSGADTVVQFVYAGPYGGSTSDFSFNSTNNSVQNANVNGISIGVEARVRLAPIATLGGTYREIAIQQRAIGSTNEADWAESELLRNRVPAQIGSAESQDLYIWLTISSALCYSGMEYRVVVKHDATGALATDGNGLGISLDLYSGGR